MHALRSHHQRWTGSNSEPFNIISISDFYSFVKIQLCLHGYTFIVFLYFFNNNKPTKKGQRAYTIATIIPSRAVGPSSGLLVHTSFLSSIIISVEGYHISPINPNDPYAKKIIDSIFILLGDN